MAQAPKFWAMKLETQEQVTEFWELIKAGFSGETAYCRVTAGTYR